MLTTNVTTPNKRLLRDEPLTGRIRIRCQGAYPMFDPDRWYEIARWGHRGVVLKLESSELPIPWSDVMTRGATDSLRTRVW